MALVSARSSAITNFNQDLVLDDNDEPIICGDVSFNRIICKFY